MFLCCFQRAKNSISFFRWRHSHECHLRTVCWKSNCFDIWTSYKIVVHTEDEIQKNLSWIQNVVAHRNVFQCCIVMWEHPDIWIESKFRFVFYSVIYKNLTTKVHFTVASCAVYLFEKTFKSKSTSEFLYSNRKCFMFSLFYFAVMFVNGEVFSS